MNMLYQIAQVIGVIWVAVAVGIWFVSTLSFTAMWAQAPADEKRPPHWIAFILIFFLCLLWPLILIIPKPLPRDRNRHRRGL